MKLFVCLSLAGLFALPQAVWAATPKTEDKLADRTPESACMVLDDGNLACVGGDPEVAQATQAFLKERADALRANPDPTENERELLKEYDRMLSGDVKLITIKPAPY
ncbi:MAG: hypothetical protein ACPH9E_12920 [Hyphomonas sp.]